MDRSENEQRIRDQFSREGAIDFANQFDEVADAEAVADEALQIFEAMIPDMAYVDDPNHLMAPAVVGCCGALALYLALKPRQVDLHRFGTAFLQQTRANLSVAPSSSMQDHLHRFVESGEASQQAARPGEFVFEAFSGDRTEFDWGMNVKSCAICHAFAKYDAMDLVPYMCATDDLMSDVGGDGLRRSGTIALGSHECDFRYKSKGEPLRLIEQYPDRIHDTAKD